MFPQAGQLYERQEPKLGARDPWYEAEGLAPSRHSHGTSDPSAEPHLGGSVNLPMALPGGHRLTPVLK